LIISGIDKADCMVKITRNRNLLIGLVINLVLFNHSLKAQLFYTAEKINTDSLSELLKVTEGEERIPALNKLASAYFYTKPELSLSYAREADSLLPRSVGLPLFYETRLALGTAYMSLGVYPNAVSCLLDANETAKISGRLDWLFSSGKLIMLTFLYTRNYDIAERMLDEFMQFDRSKVPGNLLFEIMVSAAWAHWFFLGNYEQALRFQHICLAVSDTVPIPRPNMALCYYQMGICQYHLQRYDSAEIYFRKAEAFSEGYQVSSLEQYRSYWVDILARLGKYDEALKMIEELTALMENRKHNAQAADDYQKWGEILAELNLPEQAIGKFKKALEYGEWVKANRALSPDSLHNIDYWYTPGQNVKEYVGESGMRKIINAHLWLYKQYDKLKETKNALYHHVRYEEESRKLANLERDKMVMETETRYQTQKKEQQIISLAQQNQIKEDKLRLRGFLLIVIACFLAVIMIIAILLIRQNRLKSTHHALVLEQKLLRSQMNPHFIFNTLANIQTFILQEDPEKASRYLARFSKLVRNILDNTIEEYVTLDREISTVENYLELQKLRYAGKFDYSIRIGDRIYPEEIFIPPMLSQPFIENALEHGIKHKEGPGMIEIDLSLNEKDLIFQITDEGVGRERAKEIESTRQKLHRSVSTSITAARLEVLRKKYGKKISLEITDLRDPDGNPTGTRVTFVFEG